MAPHGQLSPVTPNAIYTAEVRGAVSMAFCMTCLQPRREVLPSGMMISASKPPTAYTCFTCPPRLYVVAASMSRVPYPVVAGGVTGGPPLSIHLSRSWLFASSVCQLTRMRPPETDSAPYLAALSDAGVRQTGCPLLHLGDSGQLRPGRIATWNGCDCPGGAAYELSVALFFGQDRENRARLHS